SRAARFAWNTPKWNAPLGDSCFFSATVHCSGEEPPVRAAVTLLLKPNRIRGLLSHQEIMQRALQSHRYPRSVQSAVPFSLENSSKNCSSGTKKGCFDEDSSIPEIEFYTLHITALPTLRHAASSCDIRGVRCTQWTATYSYPQRNVFREPHWCV